ncbi:UDP-N-acetylmuramoyl-tripeptide--D-alanyl-D-alanine ligase [Brevirhabdus sp.]|uniref:UDP-N-acetylmuramoyl-tripeptide--D-alanyl-D- alanine ligase n=1 Tax=Brevirhabdus sp. TaxID=2004514 RepID=UPI004059640F
MNEVLWTSDDAARATGGHSSRDWAATGVSIDTRALQPGDLFVALRDQRDGHEFVAQALANGAAAALVSHRPDDVPEDAPLLIVPDVLRALEALGRAGRARTRARVVGVTGSVGKTSTKEMLRAVLGGQGRVHAAERSFNNHWGVPLTLARLPRDADFAVIEIGMNHPGEIAPLARMARPDVAVITTVAAAHLEAFGSIEDIAVEKAAIFEGLEERGVAVINRDIATAGILLDAARERGARVIGFGARAEAAFRLIDVRMSADHMICRIRHAEERPRAGADVDGDARDIMLKLSVPGRHFATNACAVLAVAEALGCDLGLVTGDLGRWTPPAGRGTRERLQLDPVERDVTLDLIDDAFNANPASMDAALEVLAATQPIDSIGRIGHGRRIAVLGDMLELGAGERQLHADLAAHPAIMRIDTVHCVGPRMRALHAALPPDRRGKWAERAEDLAPGIRHMVDAGDVVLVKGSKGSRVSLVVDAIRKLSQAEPDQA